MIEVGAMTLIGEIPYTCVKIEGKMAYMQRVGDNKKGRYKTMPALLVPYIRDNEIFIPPPLPVNRKRLTRLHYMKIIKDEVTLPISNDLAFFVAEQLENYIAQLAICAEKNAKMQGHKRITASHWYAFNLSPHQGHGYWPTHVEIAKDYKDYLRNKDV
tara:strand:- start:2244 stop:2717 length:474 start_codon:yes stop_codon:yes gene_type:complete